MAKTREERWIAGLVAAIWTRKKAWMVCLEPLKDATFCLLYSVVITVNIYIAFLHIYYTFESTTNVAHRASSAKSRHGGAPSVAPVFAPTAPVRPDEETTDGREGRNGGGGWRKLR
ncbi:hypothetical protein C8R47DRAFT_1064679 [Mycena vitilis]|nr:hypothetical protein C8R47DRAFT_1064679 [Mycena vitilis]